MSISIRKLSTSQRLFCTVGMALCGVIFNPNMAVAGTSQATNSIINQEKQEVSGTVTDENKQPLAGVLVSIAGTTTGDITRADGTYSINAAVGETLNYSFIGYKTHVITVGTEALLNVQLEVEMLTGDEVVVVGFGTAKKSSLTGSISVIKADQLAERPVQNVAQALQGMVPGLNLTTSNSGGQLNKSLNINVRGGGTIGSGSNSGVLVLIDGMEGDMNILNPQDIESISVMKDAASATIYGSRAPFGVILITTKRGRTGKATLNYNNSFRWSAANIPEQAGTWDRAAVYNTAAAYAGQDAVYNDYVLDKFQQYQRGEIDYTSEPNQNNDGYTAYGQSWADTDWMDVYFGGWAASQEHNASISGGSEKIQYLVSANILDQTGSLKLAPDTYDRYTFSAKINAELASWAQFGMTTRFSRINYNRSNLQDEDGLFYHNVQRAWSSTPLEYPSIGTDMPYANDANIGYYSSIMYGGRHNEQNDVLSQQFNLTLEPIKGWTVIAEMNMRMNNDFDNSEELPVYYQRPDGLILAQGTGQSGVWERGERTNFLNPNVYTNYEKILDSGHAFKAMVGFQAESHENRYLSGSGRGLVAPGIPTLDNTTTQASSAGTYDDWATTGFFARLNYEYKEKYLLEVNARYDGTSRFLEDQRWNLFPSVSLGWNISKEDFMKEAKSINMLKVRASWGQLGNQNTDYSYPFYQNLGISKNNYWLIDGGRPSAYVNGAPALIAQSLTWETVETWNVGLDFAFFDYRLTGSADYFIRKTLNMIGPAPTMPDILGINVPKENNSDLESKGWELELSWRDRVESIGLSYGIRGTVSDARQTVTRYPDGTINIEEMNTWYSGKVSNEIWGYTTVGIAQTQEEMDNHLANANQSAIGSEWAAGDIMYKDLNGDGIINGGSKTPEDPGDLSIIGNRTPRYSYGITADVAWRGFDFSIFLQGIGKRDYNAGGNVFYGITGGWQSTVFNSHLDYWRPADDTSIFGPNTDGYFARPILDKGYKNQQDQTRYLQDASYMRIKNMQLGYTLPSKVTDKIKFKSVRVFVSVDNLATFTKLSESFDPETIDGKYDDGKTYPISKTVSFGINVTL